MGQWGKREDMVVHEQHPYNAEPPRAALAGQPVTATDTFYSRNHGPVPDIETQSWRLRLGGTVQRPVSLSLADLMHDFEPHTIYATLQCAGNRRGGFNEVRAIAGEDPWGPCATSTAQWVGVRLRDVLRAAGLADDAAHVAFGAPDRSALADPAQTYGASIPIGKAMSPEVLLAWHMNGAALTPVHGAPVRVVVPGFIGARSVKWLQTVTVQAAPSDNYFQAVAYRLLPAGAASDGPGAGFSLSSVALNCDVLSPEPGAHVRAGRTGVTGYSFAGDDRSVVRVDVSTDGSRSWTQAELDEPAGPWTWQHWRTNVELAAGPTTILVRAWDSTGAVQPESAAHLWNPKGYVNNSWARVTVTAY